MKKPRFDRILSLSPEQLAHVKEALRLGQTPADIIRAVQPDVLVKGADWAADAIVGRDTVEARGGKVVRVPVEQGWSTTAILERMKRTS